ncbi:MAG: Spy/CpxP family protein refolding chaperone [Pseudomonadota bacterium]
MKTRQSAAARPTATPVTRLGLALGAGVLGAAALWSATQAHAQPVPAPASAAAASVAPPPAPPEARGERPPFRHMERGGDHRWSPGAGPMGWADPRRLDRLLDRVKATDTQRTRIHEIAAQAAKDLQGQREAGRKLHEQMTALLTAKDVDARAVEKLRQQMVAHHDQASKRMTTALVDASKVLTPEQRVQVAQHLQDRQARRDERRGDRRDGPGPRAGVPQPPSAPAAR